MVKFIHTADIHLASPMRGLPAGKGEERRRELRATFGRIASFASKEGYRAVLLSGDVFDADRPLKKDKEYFFNTVKSHPGVDFLYLRGNHDRGGAYEESLPNLKTFSDRWTYYDYGDAVIAGIELTADNALSFYSTLSLNPLKTNIVMLHGQLSEGAGEGLINLARLRGKHIDYLALGHVHSFKSGRIDERGVYAYCGTPEPRGFDETGVKGIITLDCTGTVKSAFVPFSSRTVREMQIDLSTCADWATALGFVKNSVPDCRGDMVKIILKGNVAFDSSGLAEDVLKELEPRLYCVRVTDATLPAVDVQRLSREKGLRGAFVNAVLARGDLSPEEKLRVILIGVRAMEGREEDI